MSISPNTGAARFPALKAVIIGGGYIGLEIAAVAIKAGLAVTVLESAPRVLARVTAPEMSAFYTRVHREAGVDVQVGVQIAALENDGRTVSAVVLADGSRIAAGEVSVRSKVAATFNVDYRLCEYFSIDLLAALPPPHPQLVFVTAYDAFAVRAFEVNALDYLLKPVTPARLAGALQRLAAQPLTGAAIPTPPETALTLDDRVFVRSGATTRFVPVAAICAVKSCENYTELLLLSGERLLVVSGEDAQLKRIGSALWETTTSSGSTDTRGWAIVPKSDDVQVTLEGERVVVSGTLDFCPGRHRDGGYATHCIVPTPSLIRLPEAVSFVQGAAATDAKERAQAQIH